VVFFWGTLIGGIYYSSLPAMVEPLNDQNITHTSCGPSAIFAISGTSINGAESCASGVSEPSF